MTGLQLQSMEAKSVSDLSKKDSIITALETVNVLILLDAYFLETTWNYLCYCATV